MPRILTPDEKMISAYREMIVGRMTTYHYGVRDMAGFLGVTEETMRKYLKRPETMPLRRTMIVNKKLRIKLTPSLMEI